MDITVGSMMVRVPEAISDTPHRPGWVWEDLDESGRFDQGNLAQPSSWTRAMVRIAHYDALQT